MQRFIPSVLLALEALLKGPKWLLYKVISIFFGSKKSPPPPPPVPSLALQSLSDSPYESAHSQQAPYQSPRQPSVRPPAARAPQVFVVPVVTDPHERPLARAPEGPVLVPVVIDPRERPVARAPQVTVVPVVIDPHEHPTARAPEPEVPVARVVIDPHEDPKSLRLKATQEGDWMRECLKERDEAKARGEQQRAGEFTQRSKEHRENMTLLNKAASAKIFQANNQNCSSNVIDLHGLHVLEALSFFNIAVQGVRDCEESSLCVIVGKGIHSEDNTPKIKPAIQAYGERLGLSIEVDPRNDGRLIASFE